MRRLAGVVSGALLAASLTSGCVLDLGSLTRTQALEERTLAGDSGPKLAVFDIEGILSEASSSSLLGVSQPSILARTREALDLARQDDEIAGILLRIRSPGGSASASEALHYEIIRFKRETGRPVIAYLQGIAASGGYYVAMAADRIVAQPNSVTGSIGVVLAGINLSGLMDRFGVEDQTLTSGPFKDSGSPFRPMRPEERAQLQSVLDDLHERFVEAVTQGRPNLKPEQIHALADGRVFSASQAFDLGLVDELGHFDDAIGTLKRRLGVSEVQVVAYQRPSEFRENVYTGPPVAIQPSVNVNLLPVPGRGLEPGFYYLWPPALAPQ